MWGVCVKFLNLLNVVTEREYFARGIFARFQDTGNVTKFSFPLVIVIFRGVIFALDYAIFPAKDFTSRKRNNILTRKLKLSPRKY